MPHISKSLESRSALIDKLPVEMMREIFKHCAESNPELPYRSAVDLCLVSRYWNEVANNTPQLWTKINLTFPFSDLHLSAASKRVRASKLEGIDVSIDFRDPDGLCEEPDGEWVDFTYESIWVKKITAVLEGTARRWKSIKVVSKTWLPLQFLIVAWRGYTNLPSLESISVERDFPSLGMHGATFVPLRLDAPETLFDSRVSAPKLRELSLSGVHFNWHVFGSQFQRLRKLEIKNQTSLFGPTFGEFATMLSSSFYLECLDVSGFCPEEDTAEVPLVYLPELRDFTFGWKHVVIFRRFLEMFQIGSSLENLTLLDMESGLKRGREGERTGDGDWAHSSDEVFRVLLRLANAPEWDPEEEEDLPPDPFISMRRVKNLRIAWTKVADLEALIPFLEKLTEVEYLQLEDVSRSVFEAVVSVGANRATASCRLETLDSQWRWQTEIPSFAGTFIRNIKAAGARFSTEIPGR